MTDLQSPDQKLFSPDQKLSSLHDIIETGNYFINDKGTLSDYKRVDSTKINSILEGNSQILLKDTSANINPLALLSFGISGFLMNLGQTGLYPMNAMVAAFGFFFGGGGLILCGLMEWQKNHMAGAITNISFGFFWISNIATGIFEKLGWESPPDPITIGVVLFLFGSLLFVLFLVHVGGPLVVKLIFMTAFLSFWIQAVGILMGKKEKMSAVLGTVCCGLAIYSAFSEILNESYKRTILPMGPTFARKKIV